LSKKKNIAERFAQAFEGLARVYGRYDIPAGQKPNGKGKVEGVRKDGAPGGSTRHIRPEDGLPEDVWPILFDDHLSGKHGLGVVPINDQSLARFGAIDDDRYPVDPVAFNKLIREKKLPLIVCRTKSAGAHAYLFTKGFVPAELIHSKLLEWEVALGRPAAEVFPKQTRLAGEADEGNWINLPYFGGDVSTRYALDPITGESVSLEAFLDLIEKTSVTEEELRAIIAPLDEASDDLFKDGPPCLQTLAARGFPEGSRNNGLFSIAVYLKKRYPADWADRIGQYNMAVMDPPMAAVEVTSTQKSVAKKSYSYKCKDQPIVSVCNRAVCLKRDFGVYGGNDDPGVVFGPLTKLKTDPPTWIWDVDGVRLEVTTEQLMDQRAFARVAVERLNRLPALVKASTWEGIVRERIEAVEEVEVPEDATREGQLWVQLSKFCTGRSVGKKLDELLLGKPYTDEVVGRSYFCAADFLQFLAQHRVQVNEKDLYRFLRRRADVRHHGTQIKGKFLNYWSVKAFDRQTAEHDVPRKAPPEAM
jgi:hypothetical protein